jgi:hypothetical protein
VDFLFGNDTFSYEDVGAYWEFSSSIMIFNELQQNFQVWQGFINVPESFSYKDFLFILATQGNEGRWYLMTD